ncbi:hypothetical protein BJ508DRAFT_310946 [Ascobolus immersus RN42]|uniref:Uncharacterized protein n=1 Tax=Ascobolus immersus RN42 TaxID=1160509 RepID=A0A3N4HTL7_ASCIM|nr:hypothetical protein BJ508DRAFT_310946 [Ascobolus immersus RN42]
MPPSQADHGGGSHPRGRSGKGHPTSRSSQWNKQQNSGRRGATLAASRDQYQTGSGNVQRATLGSNRAREVQGHGTRDHGPGQPDRPRGPLTSRGPRNIEPSTHSRDGPARKSNGGITGSGRNTQGRDPRGRYGNGSSTNTRIPASAPIPQDSRRTQRYNATNAASGGNTTHTDSRPRDQRTHDPRHPAVNYPRDIDRRPQGVVGHDARALHGTNGTRDRTYGGGVNNGHRNEPHPGQHPRPDARNDHTHRGRGHGRNRQQSEDLEGYNSNSQSEGAGQEAEYDAHDFDDDVPENENMVTDEDEIVSDSEVVVKPKDKEEDRHMRDLYGERVRLLSPGE